jgi:hypothetical protein
MWRTEMDKVIWVHGVPTASRNSECYGCIFLKWCGGLKDLEGKCPAEHGGEKWAIRTVK